LPVTGTLDKQTREVLNTPVWEYLDQIKTDTQKYEKELAQQKEQIHQLENKVDSAITILSEE
jgi:cell division septum initiation protein DivIVA